ncbi:putative holin [Rahnella contaminans]|uniref:putative holin n=1 Tax=Rahnella contaminans TaxID=2703882 RepID=UPI003C2D72E3
MGTSLSSGSGFTALIGSSIVGVVSGLDSGCLLGAFSGAIAFVVSAADFYVWQRWLLFGVSFFTGIVSAEFTSSLLTTLLPHGLVIDNAFGALISSASSVRILMMLTAKPSDQRSLFDRFRGGRR